MYFYRDTLLSWYKIKLTGMYCGHWLLVLQFVCYAFLGCQVSECPFCNYTNVPS